jgi:phenylacetic acid degradation operon negative regulatory protein
MADDANYSYEPSKTLTAKELVIDFLSNRAPREMAARVIVDSAAALGFSEQSIRMALTRLVEEELVLSPARGLYRLAPSGDAMRREVRKWRTITALTQSWSYAWICIYDAPIARSDRAALRRHEQAIRLRGFREFRGGLWLRPANLRVRPAELREELGALGLHRDALVAEIRDLDEDAQAEAMRLWNVKALLASYEVLMRAMESSGRRVERMELADAAGETLVLGRDVVRHINLDPLLPEELMPQQPLRTMVHTMLVYDDKARAIWRRFMSQFDHRTQH